MDIFNLDLTELGNGSKRVNKKVSMRVIVRRDNCFLMLSSRRGDLGFPGGGVEEEESFEEASKRELLEETGYMAKDDLEYLGCICSSRVDIFNPEELFLLESHFFTCSVQENPVEVSHTESEIAMEIQPEWKTRDEIYATNEQYKKRIKEKDIWVEQVEIVLNLLEDKL